MLDYLIANKEWIFSGVGVFALSGFFFAVRRVRSAHAPAPQSVSTVDAPRSLKAPGPRNVEAAAPESKLMLYVSDTARIKNGDYFVLPKPDPLADSPVRITLKEIDCSENAIPRARLHVEVGGALVACGCAVEKVATNEFLLPARAGEEEDYSAFSFFTYPTAFLFLRVFVSHINQHTGEIEISFVQARSVWK